MVQTSLFLHAARFRLRFLFGVWWTCSAGSGTGSGGSGETPPTGGSALPSVVLVVPRDRELLLAFLHHFPALGVRDLVVVVLPGARELAGTAAHSGLAAAVRPAPPSLNMKRLERYDETKTSFGCLLDSGSARNAFAVFVLLL